MRAQVFKSAKREFFCKILSTGEMVQATALGKLLKKDSIVVGDFVELETIADSEEYQISSVDERESEIFRISIRENKKKVTAANCDVMVILLSVSKPAFKRGIIDRFLVRASQWQIAPIVVFNKMDEYDSSEFDIQFEKDRLDFLKVPCYEISAKFYEQYENQYFAQGFNQLLEDLKGKLAIFLGQSGVGKSKTISALSQGEFELKTSAVGKVGKGSHTTTWSEIIELSNFKMIDSPGIRSFSLDDLQKEDFIQYFPDLEEKSVECKFRDCQHKEGTKGCAFYHEDLDEKVKEIYLSRLDAYWRLLDEISQTPDWNKI